MSSLCGPTIAGKRALEQVDDFGGVVHRQRGLRHISEIVGVARREGFGVGQSLDQRDGAGRQLAHGADHFRMAGVADQHDLAAALVMDLRLAMHLGDQRTGGVEREQIALAPPPRERCAARHARRKSPARRYREPRRVPRRKSRPWRAGSRPRSGCARSRGAHRPAARKSRARARPIRWRAPRRRKNRAASTAAPSVRAFAAAVAAITSSKSRRFLASFKPRHGVRRPTLSSRNGCSGADSSPYIPATFRSSPMIWCFARRAGEA